LGAGFDLGAFEAAVVTYTLDDLTLCAELPAFATTTGPIEFEISTDPDFLAGVSTFAGTNAPGADEGPRSAAEFAYPSGLAQDAAGNFYIADTANHKIRKVSLTGVVSTIAGTGAFGFVNGAGPNAKFAFPAAVAAGPNGNLYVADTFNHCIRKLTKPAIIGQPWTVTTLAGNGVAGFANGSGAVARFNLPQGLVVDALGSVFVADSVNHRIRKVTAAGAVSTFAGSGTPGDTDGPLATAEFHFPFGLDFDADGKSAIMNSGGKLYVADRDNHRIRTIDLDTGMVSTLAGDTAGDVDDPLNGPAGAGRFNKPVAVTVDPDGNLYVADELNHKIRKVIGDTGAATTGVVTTTAGLGDPPGPGYRDGSARSALFHCPSGLLVDNRAGANGDIFVADAENHVVRSISVNPITVTATLDGTKLSYVFDPEALGLNPNTVYFFRWKTASFTQQLAQAFVVVGPPSVVTEPATDETPDSARLHATANPSEAITTVAFQYSTRPGLALPLEVATPATSDPASLVGPDPATDSRRGIAIDNNGNLFFSDRLNHRILRVSPAGNVSVFAGSGTPGFNDATGLAAQFDHPAGIAVDGSNNLYVADEFNHRIRKITPARVVTTLAGSGVAGFGDGPAASALFLYPTGVAAVGGNNVRVADSGNHRIRSVSGGNVTTLAGNSTPGFTDGTGAAAAFNSPVDVAVNGAGDVYVADELNHSIRKVTAGGVVTTVAGTGAEGFADGPGASAQFAFPSGIAVDDDANALVADRGNHRIRRVDPSGEVTTHAGSGIEGYFDTPGGKFVPAGATRFSGPSAIAAGDDPGELLVADAGNGVLRRIIPGAIRVIAAAESPLPAVIDDLAAQASLVEPLWPGTPYYFRAVATNVRGTIEGDILSFMTFFGPDIAVFDGPDTSAPAVTNGQTDAVDFGGAPVGNTIPRTFTIANDGDFVMNVTSIGVPAGYALTDPLLPTTVDPGNSLNFEITLNAVTGEVFAGDVTIANDDPDIDPDDSLFTFPITGVLY
ncbi:MAG: choice-of-anchor D domain-containing protein, partial [Akkermansiaceae bacterium]|nr:choice-of-anchor D domain-containing protein [Akkermansiaceae bacterium]